MHINKKSRNTFAWVLLAVITLAVPVYAQNGVSGGLPSASVSVLDSTKDQDGLVGSVRRVKVQSVKLEVKSGHLLEGALQLLEVTTYGLNGDRIDNASYPVAESSAGKEEYKYDDRGNIVEMTLRGDDGSILSRENYRYEFDTFGNWRKMVTRLVVFEGGELKHEPIEVTYREISYYFDDSVAKIVKRSTTPILLPTASPRFPDLLDSLNANIQPYITAVSHRPLLVGVGGEPPALPTTATEKGRILPGPATESNKPAAIKTEPGPITASNEIATPVTKGTVPLARENPHSPPTGHEAAVAFYQKGLEYFGLGALKDAVDSYKRSLELESESAEVFLSLGHAYLKLKNIQEAGKAFKQAIRLNPEMVEAHYGLGLHYFALGRYKNAADAFKRATVLRPNLAKAHYALALAYQGLGRLDDVTAQIRILETLDSGLARKLSERPVESNLPCRVSRLCY